jgi:hypothetical protein
MECAWLRLHTSPWLADDGSHWLSHIRRLTPEELQRVRSMTPSERLDQALELMVEARARRKPRPAWRQ